METVLMPSVAYQEPLAALRWLESAFGFDIALLLTDDKGNVAHAEMAYRDARIGIMREWSNPALLGPAEAKSPKSLDGAVTQFLWLYVDDVRAHCEAARKAGAKIVQEPADQAYGDRTYRALDCDGHVWIFRQRLNAVPIEKFAAETGLTLAKAKE
jgi:uncharacterized glyoxalase superfamily protein PhnB